MNTTRLLVTLLVISVGSNAWFVYKWQWAYHYARVFSKQQVDEMHERMRLQAENERLIEEFANYRAAVHAQAEDTQRRINDAAAMIRRQAAALKGE